VDQDRAKQLAAVSAVDAVQSGMAIGLGTGSTVRFVIEEIGRRVRDGRLTGIVGVPTSDRTAALASEAAIPLTTLSDHPRLALTIDGADEIDPGLNLIKGLGGALLREKVVAAASDDFIVVADATKIVPQLGSRAPVPVEVLEFGVAYVQRRLARLSGRAVLRTVDNRVFQTDEGNVILDYYCGPIADAWSLDIELKQIPGVVDHGLFLGMASQAMVAEGDQVRVLRRM
jgi:ribose 5-phosphate isomerase A